MHKQHVLTDAVRLIYAFKRDTVVAGPDLYYANVASALSLIKTSLYLITTIIFDAFIVSGSGIGVLTVPHVSLFLAPPLLRHLGPQLHRDLVAVPDLLG